MKLIWNFWRGGVFEPPPPQKKKHPWGRHRYFLEQCNVTLGHMIQAVVLLIKKI